MAENWHDVSKAKVKEIAASYDLGCFERCSRHRSNNIIDARWVIIWNMIEGNVGVKCRLVVRGFKGKFQDPDVYPGATSRSGQRLVNAVAAGNPKFFLISFDVSQAIAKGMTFEELSALPGQGVRKVGFYVPKTDIECQRQLHGSQGLRSGHRNANYAKANLWVEICS